MSIKLIKTRFDCRTLGRILILHFLPNKNIHLIIQALTIIYFSGGGWTVFQRRQDGSVNFDRSWKEYKEGFGDLHTEYWLGNEHIHDLTSQGDYMLRIDLEDWSGKHKHAVYQSFR